MMDGGPHGGIGAGDMSFICLTWLHLIAFQSEVTHERLDSIAFSHAAFSGFGSPKRSQQRCFDPSLSHRCQSVQQMVVLPRLLSHDTSGLMRPTS